MVQHRRKRTIPTLNKKRRSSSRQSRKKQPIYSEKSTSINSFLVNLKLFSFVFTIVLIAIFGLGSFFYSVHRVSGYGMMPTLRDQDVLLSRRRSEVKRFDLVLLQTNGQTNYRRIIGLPGETIRYEDDRLYVNDQVLDEKFIIPKINEKQAVGTNFTSDFTLSDVGTSQVIPEHHYLVLGDNRPYTTDSRDYGFIKQDEIHGTVIARIYPFEMLEKF